MCAKIFFESEGLCQEVASGSDFQKLHALYPQLPLKFGCRNGECGVCAIYIVKGMQNLTKLTKEEQKTLARKALPAGFRLACQCALNGDVTIGKN
jgi:ferredoxin